MNHFTKYREGLDANVADLKKSEAGYKHTLISEESLKIGGLDAKKLVFKNGGASTDTVAHFLVATSKYKIDGVDITGFYVIAALYDRPENKTIIDDIISSWRWK